VKLEAWDYFKPSHLFPSSPPIFNSHPQLSQIKTWSRPSSKSYKTNSLEQQQLCRHSSPSGNPDSPHQVSHLTNKIYQTPRVMKVITPGSAEKIEPSFKESDAFSCLLFRFNPPSFTHKHTCIFLGPFLWLTIIALSLVAFSPTSVPPQAVVYASISGLTSVVLELERPSPSLKMGFLNKLGLTLMSLFALINAAPTTPPTISSDLDHGTTGNSSRYIIDQACTHWELAKGIPSCGGVDGWNIRAFCLSDGNSPDYAWSNWLNIDNCVDVNATGFLEHHYNTGNLSAHCVECNKGVHDLFAKVPGQFWGLPSHLLCACKEPSATDHYSAVGRGIQISEYIHSIRVLQHQKGLFWTNLYFTRWIPSGSFPWTSVSFPGELHPSPRIRIKDLYSGTTANTKIDRSGVTQALKLTNSLCLMALLSLPMDAQN
jgi:hypothetical protein